MEEIVTNAEYLGWLMVCCAAYEGLYLVPKSKPGNYSRLKLAVEELYQKILEFLVETAKYLNRKTLGRLRIPTCHIWFISLTSLHRPRIQGNS